MGADQQHARARLAKTVKRMRLLRGWSQEQLAERAGKTHKSIYRVERGSNVRMDVLDGVAAGLGVDVTDLFGSPLKASNSPKSVITQQEIELIDAALRIVARLKRRRSPRKR
jgi:transcriptional regulator with XRE-family HTH domain